MVLGRGATLLLRDISVFIHFFCGELLLVYTLLMDRIENLFAFRSIDFEHSITAVGISICFQFVLSCPPPTQYAHIEFQSGYRAPPSIWVICCIRTPSTGHVHDSLRCSLHMCSWYHRRTLSHLQCPPVWVRQTAFRLCIASDVERIQRNGLQRSFFPQHASGCRYSCSFIPNSSQMAGNMIGKILLL